VPVLGDADADSPAARLPAGHVAFFHSDAAGAKACLALAFLVRQRDPAARVSLFSNRRYPFEAEWPFPVDHRDQVDAACLAGTDLVFTGTSHPDSSGGFELGALELARAQGLPSRAFVDHWVRLRKRFERGERLVLPDRVLLLDEHALSIALAEGLPRERLELFASPYLYYLRRHWRPTRSRAEVLGAFGLTGREKVVLFAPDPISLYDQGAGRGFTEVTAARDLIEALGERLRGDVRLVVSRHPLQPAGPFDEVLGGVPGVVMLPAGVSGPALAHASDLVVGFHSNFLLEADALGKQVVRYCPGDPALDPLAHLGFGIKVGSPAALKTVFERLLAPDA
jgi:hypothetical protein